MKNLSLSDKWMYYAGILAAFGTNVDVNDLKHIQDLLEAEEQDLLLKLPCKTEDVIQNARNLYESTCKQIRDMTVQDYVCGMCKWDCDMSITPSGDYMSECPGFEKDDCFELNVEKYNSIVFKTEAEKALAEMEK